MNAFFRFDMRWHMNSPVTWIMVLVFALLAFTSSNSISLGGTIGNANVNAPMAILQISAIFFAMSLLFIVLVIAQPLLRDHEIGIAELFFAKPMRKFDYIMGRLLAGICICTLLYLVMLSCLAVGMHVTGDVNRVAAFSLAPYLFAFFAIILPNMLFMAGLMSLLASTTRSILMVYVGVVGFLALWALSNSISGKLESDAMTVLLDPLGIAALSAMSKYWVVRDFNTRMPEFSSWFLMNRIMFSSLGIGMLALAVLLFKPIRSGTSKSWFARKFKNLPTTQAQETPIISNIQRRRFTPASNPKIVVRQFLHLTVFDALSVIKGKAFIVFSLIAVLLYWTNMNSNMNSYAGTQYPITSWMLERAAQGMGASLSLILIFYAGELMFRERAVKMHEVTAVCPTPTLLPLLAKMSAILCAALMFMLILAVTGVMFQIIHQYYNFEFNLYAKGLLVELLPYIILAIMALALQALIQNKYIAYGVLLLVYGFNLIAGKLGVEDNLLLFGSSPRLQFSDLNGYGVNFLAHLSFQAYWILFAALILLIASSTLTRNSHENWTQRRKMMGALVRGRMGVSFLMLSLSWIGVGGWIFYNTHVLQASQSSKAGFDLQQAYELEYKQFEFLAQPKITALDVDLDMSPKADTLSYKVRMLVMNPHAAPITELHLLVNKKLAISAMPSEFGTLSKYDPRFGLSIFHLKTPLVSGASVQWEFQLTQVARGFSNQGGRSMLLENGTYLHSYRLLPSFGFNRDGRIQDPVERKKRGLPALLSLAKIDDPAGLHSPFNGGLGVDGSDDADWINFNTVVSTDDDQIALAPGKLEREWRANGRHYFHYKMQGKMDNYAAWLSGKWDVKRDQWQSIPIEVYSHPGHNYNTKRMIEAAKASLDYYSQAFSPYAFPQLRIVEFPRTVGEFAEAFAGTVPFSESIGFVSDLRDQDKVDNVFYVTAHEVAHQWWGHQVMAANVQGTTMVVESLSAYSALMVMKKQYGSEHMRQFLRRELDTYLVGRGRDRREETPLNLVDNQPHIHYAKGSLAFYRLAEEIGEDAVNRALKNFVAAKAFKAAPYATTIDLIQFIRAEAKPEQQQLITDLFEKICLYDNRVTDATAVKRADGRYDVTFKVTSSKFYADGKGAETSVAMDDNIELAVFSRPASGKEKDETVLHMERRRVTSAAQTIHWIVDKKPYEVGIDPYNKLIDRISVDNRKRVN